MYIMYTRYIREAPCRSKRCITTPSPRRALTSAPSSTPRKRVSQQRCSVTSGGRPSSTPTGYGSFLVTVRPARAEVVAEAGGWSVLLPGLPIAADGETFDEALDEMVAALREYSQDWADHLRHASNHQQNWGLVQIIDLSSDEELHDWLQR